MRTFYPAPATSIPVRIIPLSVSKMLKRSFFSGIILLFANLVFSSGAFGQIVQRGVATSATSTTTTITINKPTGVVAGDIMIVNINQGDNDNGTLGNASRSGWTLIAGDEFFYTNPTSWWGTVLYRVADGTEGANFSFTLDGSVDYSIGAIVAFSGVNVTGGLTVAGGAGGPFDVTPGTLSISGNTSNPTATGKTTVTANAGLVMLTQHTTNRTMSGWSTTNPGALTELLDFNAGGSYNMAIGIAGVIKATTGPTGNGTVTLSGNARSGSILLALRPCVSPAITGTLNICAGSTTQLTGAPTAAATNPWVSATPAVATVSNTGLVTGISAGTSIITYKNSAGCTNTVTITVTGAPTATAGTTQTICSTGGAITGFSATNQSNITWTTSGTGTFTPANGTTNPVYTPSPLDISNGSVTITMTAVATSPCATNATTAGTTINITPAPTATAGGSQSICVSGTATVSGASASNGTIAWTENGAGSITSGANTLTPVYTPAAGDAGNTVTLTMTVPNSPCTAAIATYTVNVYPLPTATLSIPGQTICVSGTATVSGASASNGTVSWTENGNGSITSGANTLTPVYTPDPSDAGTTVTLLMTVSSVNCAPAIATASYSVNVIGLPTAAAGGSVTTCPGQLVTVSGASSTNGTISWAENGAGTITAGGTTLTPTYTSVAGDAGNIVTLTMTVSNGTCANATASYVINFYALPATTTVTGGGTFCATTNISASGGAGGTIYFQGTTSNGTSTALGGTPQTITTSGTYYFRSMSPEGCWGPQGSVAVTINPLAGAVTANGGGTFCGSTTITATGGSGGTIYFQGTTSGGTSTATASASQIVSASGTYYFRARTAAGCWGPEGSVTVTINPIPATTTVTGGGTFCATTSISASGGAGGTIYFQGTTSNGTSTALGGTPQTITTSGTYYFRSMSPEGCWGLQGSVAVTINPLAGAVTANGGGTFCGSTSISATGGSGGTIYFQGTTSGGTSTVLGGTPQTVSASGTYYFRARTAAGCWGPEGSVTVTINPLPATTTVTGGGTFCATTSISASGGDGGTIYFQGTTSNGTSTALGGTPQTITTSGTYYFRSMSPEGCWGPQGSVAVTINPLAGAVTANGGGTFCGSTTITATGGSGGTIYFQGTTSGGTSTATASASQIVSASGTYYFRARTAAGCWGPEGSVTVTINPLPATTTVTGGGTFCATTSISASGGAGGTIYFQGTTSNGTSTALGGTPQTITTSGTYYFRSMSTLGCWGPQGSVAVTINPLAGAVTANGGGTFCGSTSISATGGSGGTIYFQGTTSGGTSTVLGGTPQTVSASGTYYFRARTAAGCWGPEGSVTVTINPIPAATSVSGDGVFCATTTVAATDGAGGTIYFQGTTSNGTSTALGGTPQTITTSGTYYFRSRSPEGCWGPEGSAVVTINPLPAGTLTATETSGTASNDNTICANAPITFTATAGYNSYIFKINSVTVQSGTSNFYTTSTLTANAIVTVDVANGFNCGATFGPLSITVQPLPVPTLNASSSNICPGDNVLFTAGGGTNYTFRVDGVAQQSGASNVYNTTTLTNGNSVTVDVRNANNCTATSTPIIITVNTLPTGTLTASKNSICAGENVNFTATTGYANYLFKVNGITVQNSAANTFSSSTLTNPSVVTVEVTNASNCKTTFNAQVITVNVLPVASLTATENSGTANDNIICAGSNINFTATAGFSNYEFRVNGISQQNGSSNTFSSTGIANNDNITVIVRNSNNCESTAGPVVVTVLPLPVGTLVASPTGTCFGEAITLTATAGFGNYNFKVNNIAVQNGAGNTYTSSTLSNGDVVTVDVTGTNGCSTTFAPVVLAIAPLPTGTLVLTETSGSTNNDGIICAGASVTFTAPTGFTNYNFLVNGTSVQNGTSNVYTSNTLTNGNTVTVAITSNGGCQGVLNTFTITVNPLPVVAATTGVPAICMGSSTTFANVTGGGIWTSLQPSIATVDAAGVVTAVSPGTTTIRYTVTNTFSCSVFSDHAVTVNALPVVSSITGIPAVCVNSTTQLANITSGGVWSSSDPLIATVSNTGLVTGVSAGTATITYQVTDGNNCSSAATLLITVNPLPVLSPITFSAPAVSFDVCAGATITLNNSTPGGVWSSSNTAIATIDPASGIATGVTDGTTIITYTFTNGNNCVASVTQVLSVHALPVPSLTGPNPICPGTIAIYTTDPGQTLYVWSIIGGTILSGGTSTSDFVEIQWDLGNGAKSIYVNYTNAFGCSGATSSTVTTGTGTLPVITGASTVCLGATETYSTEAGNVDYTWTVTGGTITSGGTLTDPSATINWTSAGSRSVSVNYSNVAGCAAASPTIFPVLVRALPTATISGTTDVCENSPQPLVTFTGAGGVAPYTFTYNINGAGNITISTISGNSITVSVPTNSPGGFTYNLISVQESSSTTCSQLQSGAAIITVNPTPTLVITNPVAVCSPATADLTAPAVTAGSTAGLSYTYWTNATATIPYATPAAATAGTYYIKGTTGAGCPVIQPVVVTVNPTPTLVITNPAAVCSPGTVNLTLAAVTTGSTPGLTLTYWTNAAATIAYGTPATATAGTYYIKGTTGLGCADVKPVTVTVNPLTVGGSVSGTATVCSGSNGGTLTLSGHTGTILNWEFSINGGANWTPIANTTTTQPYSNLGTTTLYRAVLQSGVCASANSASATITVNNPSVGGTVNTSATVCAGANGSVTLTGHTGNVIRWEFSINGGATWTNITNTTTTQNYTNITQTTLYRAVVQSGVCASANAAAATISVNPRPTGVISGTTGICPGGNATLTLTVTGSGTISGTLSTGAVFSGTAPTITVSVSPGATTVYTIATLVDANCTAAAADKTGSATVTVNPVPAVPTITPASATICQQSILPLNSGTTSTSPTTSFSNTTVYAIPDNSVTGVVSNITVSGIPAGAVINSVSVQFNINHTYDEDLRINLRAPNGAILNLVDREGGTANNFVNTIITSVVGAPTIVGKNAPFTSTYSPGASPGAVGASAGGGAATVTNFAGLYSTPNGVWGFSARDMGNSDVGSIQNWTITINYTIAAVPQAVTWSPLTDLYTDAAATVAYAGQSLTTVYLKPSTPGVKSYDAKATNGSGCSSIKTVAITVNPTPVVTITADYCIVPGKVRLVATSSVAGATYQWNTGETTPSIDVDIADTYVVVATVGSCSGTGTIDIANELVTNGDFSAGATGFVTEYTNNQAFYNGANTSGLYPEGTYAVNTNAYSAYPAAPQGYHPDFHGRDHTTGTGNFLMINGSTSLVGSPAHLRTIWEQTVTVKPNTSYYFSAWGMNLNPGSPARLQFEVNGVPVGSIAELSTAAMPTTEAGVALSNWVRFYSTPNWVSGPTVTTAVIRIINLNTTGGGNDFGLDDISFGTLSTFVTLESAPATSAQTLCVNTAITPIRYSVGNGSPSAPSVTGLPAGVTSSFVGDQLTITGTPTVPGNYTYSITTTGSCNITSVTGTINVQSATIALGAGTLSPSICAGSAVNIGFNIGGTATGANVTGLPGTFTGTFAAGVFTIGGTSATTGSYPYTVTTTGGSCAQVTMSGTITVTAATITLTSAPSTTAQSVCINTPITNIQYTVAGTATGATLSGTLPTGVTGNYIGGIYIISGTPSVAGTFNYTITTTGGSCTAATTSGSLIVTGAAVLSLTSAAGTNDQAACINTPITNITYSLANGTGANVTGLPTGVTGSFAGGIFTISGTPSVTGVFNYTINATGGCGNGSTSGKITVQAQVITFTSGISSPVICPNVAITPIVYTISGSATGATVAGLPAGLGWTLVGNTITISGSSTAAAGPYVYTITTTGTCAAATAGGTITIQAAAVGGTISSTGICSGEIGSLTLTGQAGTIVRWEYSTDGGGNWINIANTTITQPYTINTDPVMYRVLISSGCGNVYSTIATVGIRNYWTGAINSDWNNTGNWSYGILPTTTCPVVIPVTQNGVYPLLTAGITSVNILDVRAGASLTVNGATLRVAGTITSTAGINAINGVIDLNGSVTQNISGSMFTSKTIKQLLLNNNVNKTGDTLKISEQLAFGPVSGKTFAAGTSNVTILSTATATANVAELKNGNNITGSSFTVERFISTGLLHGRSWQLLATPTSGQTINQAWQEGQTNGVNLKPGYGTEITGAYNGSNGFDVFTAGPGIKFFNVATQGFDAIPAATGTLAPFARAGGYYIFIRGDRSSTLANGQVRPTILRSTGTLYTNLQAPVPVPAGKFATVGNPFASAVDIRNLNLTQLTNEFYLWDPTLGGNFGLGGYRTVTKVGATYRITPVGGIYPTADMNEIQSGQAFLLKSDGAANSSIQFPESAKVGGSRLVQREGNEATQLMEIVLSTNVPATGKVIQDGALEIFDDIFSNEVDNEDGLKLSSGTNNASFRRSNTSLSVERRHIPVDKDTMHINLTNISNLPYIWDIKLENMNVPGRSAWLLDKLTGVKTPLSLDGTTTVDFTVNTAIAGSNAADRFKIIFNKVFAPLPVTITKVTAVRNAQRNIDVQWKVEEELNIDKYTVERSADGVNFAGIITTPAINSHVYAQVDLSPLAQDNFYRIKATGKDGQVQYSNIVKVAPMILPSSISVRPNPVTGKQMNIVFVQQKGSYTAELFNNAGQLVHTEMMVVNSNNEIRQIALSPLTSAGNYKLVITNKTGKSVTQQLVIE